MHRSGRFQSDHRQADGSGYDPLRNAGVLVGHHGADEADHRQMLLPGHAAEGEKGGSDRHRRRTDGRHSV